HPRVVTDTNIKNFTKQLKRVGYSFDWSRVVDTTDQNYYKWTQWIFLKMYEKGLVFRDKAYVNYCPSCKVVLSNEDSQGGKCDICHSDVIQKEKTVWYLRITEYADKLLEGLKDVDYLPNIKLQQENWIGKSVGAFVNFKIKEIPEKLKIYTTRPDTLYGITFMVMAPEHPLIDKYKDKISNMKEIEKYREFANKKTEFERTQLVKDKTGVKIEGLTVINPVNDEEVPIYISDYVMMGYGTGAIMAVPAHDDRDYEFAKKFNIPIRQVIAPYFPPDEDNKLNLDAETVWRHSVVIALKNKNNEYLCLKWKVKDWQTLVIGGVEEGETDEEAALRELKEETGYKNVKITSVSDFEFHSEFYAAHKGVNRYLVGSQVFAELIDDEKDEIDEEEKGKHTPIWVKESDLLNFINLDDHRYVAETAINGEHAYIGEGVMINSGILNGINNKKESIEKIINYLSEKGIGEKGVQYKMKDWAFNRQRYWGEPIPIVHCPKCGIVPVPYSELPLVLPELENFEPGTDGESPLAKIDSFVNCKCPKCGADAKRETDTMPQWAGSSWYFLRYIDPHNDNEFASMDKLKYWLPVDWYNGGMEHVTRHLIYSRFWHKFLYDLDLVPTSEPYQKRTAQGIVLGPDGEKMSKSRGNVVDPMTVIEEYGADTLRTYVLFMGDYGIECPWNDESIKGVARFLDRIYNLKDKIKESNEYTKSLEIIINQTIKKVSEDIESMKFNTAIAELMKLLNKYYELDNITSKDYEVLIKLLYPFAPHITEELNKEVLHNESLVHSKWPSYDSNKITDDTYEMIIQVNGKLRDRLIVDKGTSKEQMEEIAMNQDNIKKYVEGNEIIKVITIPDKLVNIVIKGN
ncbi:MAG TPA: class I tRNA ligase family protein, partial [Bacilli bacterium]|nr:class I tRNA ligase family protein [Bacilli bacterium]